MAGAAASFFALAAFLACPARCDQPPSPPVEVADQPQLTDPYVTRFMERTRLAAGNELLTREIARLESLSQPGSPLASLVEPLQTADAGTRKTLAEMMAQGAQPPLSDLQKAAGQLDEQVRQLAVDWQATRSSLDSGRSLLRETKASERFAGRMAALLSIDNRWFWLSVLLAVAALIGAVLHDRRRKLRRVFRRGPVRALGLGILVFLFAATAAAIFAVGDREYQTTRSSAGQGPSPGETVEAATADLDAEIASLTPARRVLKQRLAQAQSVWLAKLTSGLSETIATQWREFREATLQMGEQSALLEKLAAALETDRADLEELDAELAAEADAAGRYLRMRQWIRGGLGLTLLSVVVGGGWLVDRGIKRRRAKVASTCPLCLGPIQAKRDGNSRQRPGGPDVVRCGNLISQEPRVVCGYAFRQVYRPMPKLCFPTLGVPKAGKTHWLTMLYWQLNRGDYPRSVRFEKIKKAQGDGAEDCDQTVEHLLTGRVGTAATQRDRVPHPLVFNFQDGDSWGRSNLLVNLFDYSGEVTSDMTVDDYRRNRALEADGYLFFIDPTFPSPPQAKALADFREDLRLVKKLAGGRHSRTPIALCVPKIDLLASQPFALADGADATAHFYEEMARIDPSGQAMNLKVMEARSRLVAALRETVWPGWHIEEAVQELFGSRYLFFPLTPVGLDGRGETDLSLRTIAPFGLIEPLMWLLEMNGYRVLG